MSDTTSIRIIREFDIRKVDWATGQKLAATTGEALECQCCGRAIVKVHEMANGMFVGSECAWYMQAPVYRIGRRNRKADAVLEAWRKAQEGTGC